MKTLFYVLLLAGFAVACQNKRTQQTTGKVTEDKVVPMAGQQAAALADEMPVPASVERDMNTHLLDTTGTVKGDEVKKYKVQVTKEGTYEINSTAKNPGFVFVIQDANGNNVINETNPSWKGELKKGTYTIIAGLTRNAARRSDAEATFKIYMKYISE